MPKAKIPGARVWVRLSQENYDLFEKWSRELSIPTSQLIALCAVTGSRIVIPTMLPGAREALDMIARQEEDEFHSRMADDHFEHDEQWEEFQRWKEERALHNGKT